MRSSDIQLIFKRVLLVWIVLVMIWLFRNSSSSSTSNVGRSGRFRNVDKASGQFYKLYNLHDKQDENDKFYHCLDMDIDPPVRICIYKLTEDPTVSAYIGMEGMWEAESVDRFKTWLQNDPELAVIDIGSNIGVYSLIAASLGHHVLAVEPFMQSIDRFHTSVNAGGFEDKITLIQGAISDRRGYAKIIVDKRHKSVTKIDSQLDDNENPTNDGRFVTGTLLMDDLLSVCQFEKAILKIDIEGYEHRAFAQAKELFDSVQIPVVFMDWEVMGKMLKGDVGDKKEDVAMVTHMANYLLDMNYLPFCSINGTELITKEWETWPNDIFWQKRSRDL